jgi:hypothetical protein
MGFKVISKNNMGAVATLVLVILLSQSRFLNFLIETALGRAVLIMFILGISYTNKILGVVAVLFIIIMVSNSNMPIFMEGFTDDSKEKVTASEKDKMKKEDGNKKKSDAAKEKAVVAKQKADAAKEKASADTSKVVGGREGFNIVDREGTMLRGKRSNEVPVFANARNQNDDVEPTDKSVFGGDFFHL